MIFRDVFQSQQLNEAYAVFQIIILVIKNFLEILGIVRGKKYWSVSTFQFPFPLCPQSELR